ncbi:MAG: threonine synthase [Clostridia bacterium]
MLYQSTRNDTLTATASMAILNGIAPDGGLYMLRDYSALELPISDFKSLSAQALSARVLGLLLSDFSQPEIDAIVNSAYHGRFETEELTPLVRVGDAHILELFRGPTSAFKDVALSVLPHLITAARKKNNITDDVLILTATSGDTGKAALCGFADVPGTRIIVFYPEGGVSEVQLSQMITQEGGNVAVCAIRGNFDDAQSAVKAVFAAAKSGCVPNGIRLSSANSINIGRLAPQVMYYFKAYADLMRSGEIAAGERINFVVPTGNFGNILAGYIAKRMGLPIAKLVCASNSNNVLTEFIETGCYNSRRAFVKTASPSMDILISSNLERLLFLLCGCCAQKTALYMDELKQTGSYTIAPDMLDAIKDEFFAGCCTDEKTFGIIGDVYSRFGYLMDTHTAVAYGVMQQFKANADNGCRCVVLSTASPYKFCTSVLRSIGGKIHGSEFDVMDELCARTNIPVPSGLSMLRGKAVLHTDVIDKTDILDYVLKKAGTSVW